MKKALLSLLIVLLILAVSPIPVSAASGADSGAANPSADEEIIITDMSPQMGDAGMTDVRQQGAGPGASAPIWAGMLGLTPDQLAKLKALRNQYLADTRDLRYDLAMRHLEAMRLFTDPKTSEAALLAKHREMSALRQKLMDRKGQFMIQARGILTADQLRQIDRHVLSHMMGMGAGMGMKRGTAGGCGCMGAGPGGGKTGSGMMGHGMMGPGPAGRPGTGAQ